MHGHPYWFPPLFPARIVRGSCCNPVCGARCRPVCPTAAPLEPMCRPCAALRPHRSQHRTTVLLPCCRSLELGEAAPAGVGGAAASESVPTPGQHNEGSGGEAGASGGGTGKTRSGVTSFDLHTAALFSPPLASRATPEAAAAREPRTDGGGSGTASDTGPGPGASGCGCGRPRRPSSMRALKLVSSLGGEEGAAGDGEDGGAR